MENDLIQRLALFIEKNRLFTKEDRLLLAVSGGIDSMVLWHMLKSLNYRYAIVHCNFRLRGEESDSEEDFVREHAMADTRTFHLKDFDTVNYAKEHQLSIQEAARKLRYDFFQTLCKEFGYQYIVTAHHLDDSIETFFINLLRGSGLNGLTGIPVKNDNIVRPLLFATRSEIYQYAVHHRIDWKEDSSNKKEDYLRNKIRHRLIPVVKEIKHEFHNIMSENIRRLKFEKSLIDDYLQRFLFPNFNFDDERIFINKQPFFENDKLQRALTYFLFKNGFTEQQIDYLFSFEAQVGKKIHSSTHELIIDRDTWVIQPFFPKIISQQ